MILMPFDSETGSLNPKKGDMLTAYFSFLDEDFKILDEIYFKLKPDDRLPIAEAGALKVNKINLEQHLADPETITYSQAKAILVPMIKKHLKKKGKYSNIIPFGQNVGFDIRFTQEYLLPEDEWGSLIHYGVIDTKQVVDFLKFAGWFPKDIGNLESIIRFLGLPMRPAHNAKEDTLMCVDAFKKILEIMKAKKENGSQQDLISLLEAE